MNFPRSGSQVSASGLKPRIGKINPNDRYGLQHVRWARGHMQAGSFRQPLSRNLGPVCSGSVPLRAYIYGHTSHEIFYHVDAKMSHPVYSSLSSRADASLLQHPGHTQRASGPRGQLPFNNNNSRRPVPPKARRPRSHHTSKQSLDLAGTCATRARPGQSSYFSHAQQHWAVLRYFHMFAINMLNFRDSLLSSPSSTVASSSPA